MRIGAFVLLGVGLVLGLGDPVAAQAVDLPACGNPLMCQLDSNMKHVLAWSFEGAICWWITFSIAAAGLIIAALQAVGKRWSKALVAVLGVVVGIATVYLNQGFDPSDYRAYKRAARKGARLLEGAELKLKEAGAASEQSVRDELLSEARQQLKKFDELYDNFYTPEERTPSTTSLLLPVAHAAEPQSPSWTATGRPATAEKLFFVGTGVAKTLDAAKADALANARLEAAASLAAELPEGANASRDALADYLAKAVEFEDTSFSSTDGVFRYYALVSLRRRSLQTDARLYGFAQGLPLSPELESSLTSARGNPAAYVRRRQQSFEQNLLAAKETLPDEIFDRFETGRAERRRGNPTSAARELTEVVKAAPGFYLAWYNLALALDDEGKDDLAMDAYRHALVLPEASSDPFLHNSFGYLLYRQKKFADAKAAFEAALRLDPSHALARRNLAAAQAALSSPQR
jgi:tetratricopeptide (TPR) repeat protein